MGQRISWQSGLSDAEARYRALVEQIPAIVYSAEFGSAGTWSYVSPQIESILSFSPEEWIADGTLWYRQLHPEDRERAMADEARFRETGERLSSEYRMLARDGRVVWFLDQASLLRDTEGRHVFMHGVMYDITDRKEAEEQLAFLAYHDRLTGLPNRELFEEHLNLAVTRASRHSLSVAVLYIDLDDFKLVNDTLGHAAGDELLEEVARRLTEASRETDLVARQGGDEFLVLLADLERSHQEWAPGTRSRLVAETVADRIAKALEEPIRVRETEAYASASIGISLFPDDGESGEILLKLAHSAMYESKKSGPGRFLRFSDVRHGTEGKLSMATRLRRAVERQQWELHYQPVVEMQSGTLTGVEALIRWRDPLSGLVAPGEFIPLAEEMGLIGAIGDWVQQELCAQLRRWKDQGASVKASFNLSPRQLWQPQLATSLVETIGANCIDPTSLVVEITESAAMVDPDRTRQVLSQLSAAGLGLALDDFGTGYSSLSRLKHFSLDILKIDRSFVRDVSTDGDARAMVKLIIQLAETLGMTALAEGVETEDQRRFLVDSGCRVGQGFLFSRPLPADEVAREHLGLAGNRQLGTSEATA